MSKISLRVAIVLPYGVLEPNGDPISDPSFPNAALRSGNSSPKPSMSHFVVPWATARICL